MGNIASQYLRFSVDTLDINTYKFALENIGILNANTV